MIERHIRSIVGADGAVSVDAHGVVEVSPRSEEECALVLSAANGEGWTVRLSGGGSWNPADAPADLGISTRLLNGIEELSPEDLVASTRVGTMLDQLQKAAAAENTWVTLDPPGRNRSIGSVLATGSAGPLRSGFGGVKRQVLGLTLITADGRILPVGGRVVKNVAGFDLTSLAVGSFGAFGLITSAFVRLSAVPTTDETLTASAPRKVLIDGALSILDCGLTPSAMELFTHPGSREWVLAVRSCGSAAAVESDRQKMSERAQDLSFRSLTKAEASALWEESRGALAGHSTTIRAGCLPTEVEQMLDLAESELGDSSNISVSVAAGVARWSCDATIDQIQSLRNAAALNRWPVTLERAPWNVLTAVGHYGAYRDGVGRLVASLRRVFDGDNRLMIPLGDNE